MSSRFSWEGFDPSFLRSIIMATDEEPNKERYRKTDDKDVLCSRVSRICSASDYKFIKKYRSIIENEVLSLYREPVKNICRALKMPIGRPVAMDSLTVRPPGFVTIRSAICIYFSTSFV